MNDFLERYLIATLIRVLDLEPDLSFEDGIKRVIQTLEFGSMGGFDISAAQNFLINRAGKFKKRAIVNPYWLRNENNTGFHFYLVNSQPGWISSLSEQISNLGLTVSYQILYGVYDSLIILEGSREHAEKLKQIIKATHTYEISYFEARDIPLFFRYPVPPIKKQTKKIDLDLINELVLNFDTNSDKRKSELIKEHIILGPAWDFESTRHYGPKAFVGINLAGGSRSLEANEVLEKFQEKDSLRQSLVQLYEVDRGQPFHYFAKLECNDLDELDLATDDILFNRVRDITLEGNTFLVASGKQNFPGAGIAVNGTPYYGPTIPSDHLQYVAARWMRNLSEEAIETFESLDNSLQVAILESLVSFDNLLRNFVDNQSIVHRLSSSIELFVQASVNENIPNMTGPVLDITTFVEERGKHTIRMAVEAIYGEDYKKSQDELKLSSSDFRKFTLGRTSSAFRNVAADRRYIALSEVLSQNWLDRFDSFAKNRNLWAHGDLPEDYTAFRTIEEARRMFVEGIDLLNWLENILLPAIKEMAPTNDGIIELDLPERAEDEESGVFISYSSKDSAIAENFARALTGVGFNVFFADWAIAPGDSIFGKVSEGLAQNDVLVILLSKSSVKSNWVQKEFNTASKRQLDGQNVLIVPVIIDSEVQDNLPAVLNEIKYINASKDRRQGILELIKFLISRS